MSTRKSTRVSLVCKNCNKGFTVYPSRLKLTGEVKFCSIPCKAAATTAPLIDRFFKYVGRKQADGCIPWLGSLASGYGHLRISHPQKDEDVGAHRISYELFVGPIPAGLHVCHRCDHKYCVNPTHLFVGTHQENVQDLISKGLQIKGEDRYNSKLTTNDVREIRKRCQDGESQHKVATAFHVSRQLVGDIVARKTWKHVSDD